MQLVMTRVILANVTIPGALEAMRNGTGGYKATASGSDTSGGGNRTITVNDEWGRPDVIPVTGVEAAVLNGRTDRATDDLATVYGALSALCDAAVLLSDTCARWSSDTKRITTADIRDVSKALWCPNPAHGHALAPRSGRSAYCSFCAGFRTANGVSPDETLCDRNHQGKYLTEADLKLWRIRQKAGKKGRKAA
jgi:hypothetical protein